MYASAALSERNGYDKILGMEELKKNEIVEAEITGWSSDGAGVCRVKGRAVFVPRTIPGERWEIRILKVTASAVFARGERLLQASPARIEPDCPHFGKCGGCDTRHLRYEDELRFKLGRVNDALKRIGKQEVQATEILGSEWEHRTTDQHTDRQDFMDGNIPYTEEPLNACAPHNYRIDAVIGSTVVNSMTLTKKAIGKGTVRHVFCRQARQTKDAVLCICSAAGFGSRTQALVEHLRKECPELTGIVLNINKTRGNTVLSGDFYTLWGDEILHDRLCGLEFAIAPQAFFQINPPQAEQLYEKAAKYANVGKEDLVFDLYCGAGTISLRMAKDAGRVIGAEIVPEAVENAGENARRNGIGNAEFLCGDAGEAANALAARGLRPRIVVVDPPRKGMSEEAVKAVASMAPERIVYVSCGPETLARDILRFQELGYALQEATAVDMFPRTCHVETVCCLYHQKKDFISVPYEPKDASYLKQR